MLKFGDLIAEIDAMRICRSNGTCATCQYYSWCEDDDNDGRRRPKDAPCMILAGQNRNRTVKENEDSTDNHDGE